MIFIVIFINCFNWELKVKYLILVFACLFVLFGFTLFAGKRSCKCSCKSNNVDNSKNNIKNVYDCVAKGNGCSFGGKTCGCRAKVSQDIGYSREEIEQLADADLGLGCGNPISLGEIKVGQTILDLGSGAGLDCFLASRKVGETGKVIGVDMAYSMVEKAKNNALKYGYKNVEFIVGDIENLPLANNSVDIIISNCVLSLASDKKVAFKEACRVLKRGGLMYVSDIVLLKPLSIEQRSDKKLIGTCPLGAILREEYIKSLLENGFEINILEEDFEVNKKKFDNSELPISSLKYIAKKK